MSVQKRRSALC